MADIDPPHSLPSTAEQAFVDNRLLATFPIKLRQLLRDNVEPIQLELGASVLRKGIDVEHAVFPFGSTMISMIVDLDGGRSIEVASIGNEGAVGGIVSCGRSPAFTRAEVIVAGPAVRVPLGVLETAKAESGHLRNIFCRYSDYLLAQVMQSAACSGFHPIEARAARWLLTAHDRAGGRLILTQEALAGLLGVQRTTVNAVTRQLAAEGLITTRRGTIEVNDRTGLERRSCACYDRVERFFGDMVGPGGLGSIA